LARKIPQCQLETGYIYNSSSSSSSSNNNNNSNKNNEDDKGFTNVPKI